MDMNAIGSQIRQSAVHGQLNCVEQHLQQFRVPRIVICLVGKGGSRFPGRPCCAPDIVTIRMLPYQDRSRICSAKAIEEQQVCVKRWSGEQLRSCVRSREPWKVIC